MRMMDTLFDGILSANDGSRPQGYKFIVEDYFPKTSDELVVTLNELVIPLRSGDEWTFVVSMCTSKAGYVPSNILSLNPSPKME